MVRRRTEFVFSLKALRSAAQDVVTLSTWVLIALVLLVLALQVMPWLVAARLGIEVAGAYSACMALANVGNPLLTGVILVLGADTTRREAARRAAQTLSSWGTSPLGAVLTDRRFPIPETLYRHL